MKHKVVIIEIDLTPKAQEKLEKIARDRDYRGIDQYIAECVHSKLHDMIDIPICVSYKTDKEE